MEISIVIPCHNEAADIKKVIVAFTCTTFPGHETIITDDFFTDGPCDRLS